jgi:RNA polymerase sigma-70 factor, ECF subfamily
MLARLVSDFLAALPADVRAGYADRPGLDHALAELWRRGQSPWPLLKLSFSQFATALARVVDGDLALEHIRLGELYLALSAASGDPAAIDVLERDYLTQLAPALGRLRLTAAELEEVMQRLRISLLVQRDDRAAALTAYQGRGPLLAWLRVCATREALHLRRRARPHDVFDEDRLGATVMNEVAIDDKYVMQRYHELFKAAFRVALTGLSADERLLLAQHYLDRASLETLAELHGKHRATVARKLSRARSQALSLTRDYLIASARLSAVECESVMRAAQSQLDLTLSGVLRA